LFGRHAWADCGFNAISTTVSLRNWRARRPHLPPHPVKRRLGRLLAADLIEGCLDQRRRARAIEGGRSNCSVFCAGPLTVPTAVNETRLDQMTSNVAIDHNLAALETTTVEGPAVEVDLASVKT
jgi:hypothetical protein